MEKPQSIHGTLKHFTLISYQDIKLEVLLQKNEILRTKMDFFSVSKNIFIKISLLLGLNYVELSHPSPCAFAVSIETIMNYLTFSLTSAKASGDHSLSSATEPSDIVT